MPAQSVISRFKARNHNHARCMSSALKAAEGICAQHSARFTPIRRRVFEMIWAQHQPTLAYDLLDKLRAQRHNAAPPTVYRALDFLLEHGLIHRIESLNAYVGCGDPSAHHKGQFLICTMCNAVAELDDDEIGKLVNRKARQAGFHVQEQTIEVSGLCPDCSG